jgi:hypothetical protein
MPYVSVEGCGDLYLNTEVLCLMMADKYATWEDIVSYYKITKV